MALRALGGALLLAGSCLLVKPTSAASPLPSSLHDYMERNLPRNATTDRKTWAPHSAAKAVELDTIRGTWRLNPQNSSDSVICVLVGRDDPTPRLTWDESVTGKDAWRARPHTHIVFVPVNAEVDMGDTAKQALREIPESDRAFWTPRLHFALTTLEELRGARHWLADYLDAWSTLTPSLVLRYTDSTNGTDWSTLMLDVQAPPGGLRSPNDTSEGGMCGPGVNGTCGVLARYGVACNLGVDSERGDAPLHDVRGKIAVVHQGICSIGSKVKSAKEWGAVGVLVASDGSNSDPWADSVTADLAELPVALVGQDEGRFLLARFLEGGIMHAGIFNRSSLPWAFAVDRFGRTRRLVRGEGSLAAAVLEAVQMDYEVNVKANLASQMGTTDAVIPVMDGSSASMWANVDIPAEVLERPNNGMKLLLELHCDGRLEENCPTLTQRLQVNVCESVDDGSSEDSLASCSSKPIMIAQSYTAAGREMLSAIDASPFLGAVLPRTPQRRTRLSISGITGFRAVLSIIVAEATEAELVPFRIQPVPTALPQGVPMQLTLPQGVESCGLAVSLTAGQGSIKDTLSYNFKVCFEQGGCSTEGPFMLFPSSDRFYCSNSTMIDMEAHVVPNQLNDWYSGRPGWCPGRAVSPVHRAFDQKPRGRGSRLTVSCVVDNTTALSHDSDIDLYGYVVMYGVPPTAPQYLEVDFSAKDKPGSLVEARVSGVGRGSGSSSDDTVDAVVSWPHVTAEDNYRAPIEGYRLLVESKAAGVKDTFLFPLKDVETRYLGGAVTEPVAAVKGGSNGTTQEIRVLLRHLKPEAGYVLQLSGISSVAPGFTSRALVTVPPAPSSDPSASASMRGSSSASSRGPSSSSSTSGQRGRLLVVQLAAGLAVLSLVLTILIFTYRRLAGRQRRAEAHASHVEAHEHEHATASPSSLGTAREVV